jgi:hypothetical protein
MVPDMEIPVEVLQFIEERIDSIPQLETLLMMSREEERDWLVSDVAARNYITEQRAVETLEALQRRGLVAGDGSKGFRFKPVSPEIREKVAQLARSYQLHLSRITVFIHSKPSASIKEFARAFDLKKDR